MPRSSRRTQSNGVRKGERGEAATGDSFGRVIEMLGGCGKPTVREVRENLSDLVRMAGRLRGLNRRLGAGMKAELSPYLTSILRVAAESNIVEPADLRRAVSF